MSSHHLSRLKRINSKEIDGKYFKLLAVISAFFTSLWVSFVCLHSPPPGYEISVIGNTPYYGKMLLSIAFISSLLVLVFPIYSVEVSHWWGFLLIMIDYSAYYSLPYQRNYLFYGQFSNDHLVHMGIIIDVINTGHLPDLTYPALHILGAILMRIGDFSVEYLNPILAFLFMMGFSFFFYTYSKSEISNIFALAVLIASLPLLYNPRRFTLLPWVFCLTFIPLFLYLFNNLIYGVKYNRYTILIILILPVLTLYHPLTAIFVFVSSSVYVISVLLEKKKEAGYKRNGITILLVGSILIPFWHMHHQTLDGSLRNTIASLVLLSQGTGQELSSQAESANYSLEQLILYFGIPNWGLIALYSTFASVSLIALYWKNIDISPSKQHLLFQYSIGIILGVPFMLFEIHAVSLVRSFQYFLAFSILLTGNLLWLSIVQLEIDYNKIISSALIFLLIAATIFGIFTGYTENRQTTTSDVAGYEWLYDNRDESRPLYSSSVNNKLIYYIEGYTSATEIRARSEVSSEKDITSDLSYQKGDRRGNDFAGGYITIRDRDLNWYLEEPDWRLSELDRIRESDIASLHQDREADKIYSNGNTLHWNT